MTKFLRNSTYKVSLKKTLGGWEKFRVIKLTCIALCRFTPFWLRLSPFPRIFSRIWLIIGWKVCILGLLSANCSYLLKPCFNYVFQVSILYISRKVMGGNNKLKSSKWKFLRKNKKISNLDQKSHFWIF